MPQLPKDWSPLYPDLPLGFIQRFVEKVRKQEMLVTFLRTRARAHGKRLVVEYMRRAPTWDRKGPDEGRITNPPPSLKLSFSYDYSAKLRGRGTGGRFEAASMTVNLKTKAPQYKWSVFGTRPHPEWSQEIGIHGAKKMRFWWGPRRSPGAIPGAPTWGPKWGDAPGIWFFEMVSHPGATANPKWVEKAQELAIAEHEWRTLDMLGEWITRLARQHDVTMSVG